MTKKRYIVLLEYLGITLGCAIMAVSLNTFSVPNRIAPGGVSGIATVFHYLFSSCWGHHACPKCPLFLLGVKVLRKEWG